MSKEKEKEKKTRSGGPGHQEEETRLGEAGHPGGRRAVRWHGPHAARAAGRTLCLWHILDICYTDTRSHYRGNRCPLCRG